MQIIYIYLIGINLIGLILYGIDKLKAIFHDNRISEFILILTAFLGGSLGTTIGMFLFRHKTRKLKFIFINTILLIIQIILYKHFLY